MPPIKQPTRPGRRTSFRLLSGVGLMLMILLASGFASAQDMSRQYGLDVYIYLQTTGYLRWTDQRTGERADDVAVQAQPALLAMVNHATIIGPNDRVTVETFSDTIKPASNQGVDGARRAVEVWATTSDAPGTITNLVPVLDRIADRIAHAPADRRQLHVIVGDLIQVEKIPRVQNNGVCNTQPFTKEAAETRLRGALSVTGNEAVRRFRGDSATAAIILLRQDGRATDAFRHPQPHWACYKDQIKALDAMNWSARDSLFHAFGIGSDRPADFADQVRKLVEPMVMVASKIELSEARIEAAQAQQSPALWLSFEQKDRVPLERRIESVELRWKPDADPMIVGDDKTPRVISRDGKAIKIGLTWATFLQGMSVRGGATANSTVTLKVDGLPSPLTAPLKITGHRSTKFSFESATISQLAGDDSYEVGVVLSNPTDLPIPIQGLMLGDAIKVPLIPRNARSASELVEVPSSTSNFVMRSSAIEGDTLRKMTRARGSLDCVLVLPLVDTQPPVSCGSLTLPEEKAQIEVIEGSPVINFDNITNVLHVKLQYKVTVPREPIIARVRLYRKNNRDTPVMELTQCDRSAEDGRAIFPGGERATGARTLDCRRAAPSTEFIKLHTDAALDGRLFEGSNSARDPDPRDEVRARQQRPGENPLRFTWPRDAPWATITEIVQRLEPRHKKPLAEVTLGASPGASGLSYGGARIVGLAILKERPPREGQNASGAEVKLVRGRQGEQDSDVLVYRLLPEGSVDIDPEGTRKLVIEPVKEQFYFETEEFLNKALPVVPVTQVDIDKGSVRVEVARKAATLVNGPVQIRYTSISAMVIPFRRDQAVDLALRAELRPAYAGGALVPAQDDQTVVNWHSSLGRANAANKTLLPRPEPGDRAMIVREDIPMKTETGKEDPDVERTFGEARLTTWVDIQHPFATTIPAKIGPEEITLSEASGFAFWFNLVQETSTLLLWACIFLVAWIFFSEYRRMKWKLPGLWGHLLRTPDILFEFLLPALFVGYYSFLRVVKFEIMPQILVATIILLFFLLCFYYVGSPDWRTRMRDTVMREEREYFEHGVVRWHATQIRKIAVWWIFMPLRRLAWVATTGPVFLRLFPGSAERRFLVPA